MESRKVIRNQTEISRRCWSGSRDQGAFGIGSFSRSSPFVSKEHLKIKNNTGPNADGWGGQFMADVSTGATWQWWWWCHWCFVLRHVDRLTPGLKIMRLHPDIFHIDFMTMEQMTEKRLAKNHVTFNFWGDMSIALMNGKPSLARQGFGIFEWFFSEKKKHDFSEH